MQTVFKKELMAAHDWNPLSFRKVVLVSWEWVKGDQGHLGRRVRLPSVAEAAGCSEFMCSMMLLVCHTYHGLPSKHHLGFPYVRSSPLWVVLSLWEELDLTAAHCGRGNRLAVHTPFLNCSVGNRLESLRIFRNILKNTEQIITFGWIKWL